VADVSAFDTVRHHVRIGVNGYRPGVPPSSRDYSWLPDHQMHVAVTLAHANDLIAGAADVLHNYLQTGPLQFKNIVEGDTAHVTVVAVAPLPEAVSRCVADALTQLRSAIEHTVFAEVEHQLGRELDEAESRRVEMPACTTADAYRRWLSERRRPALGPLRDGAPLVTRIGDLQPYQRRDVDSHPLRILAEHTNHAKHRSPAVAATQLGVVIPDRQQSGLVVHQPSQDRPLHPGDVLASGPLRPPVGLSIWPKVSIRRPHTGTWHVLLTELGALEDWVRRIAIPHLLTGGHEVSVLPPGLDTTVGHTDVRSALLGASVVPAAEQASRRMQADSVRVGLTETLSMHPAAPERSLVTAWVRSLTDDQVLARLDRLSTPARAGNLPGIDAVMRAQWDEIRASND
jgi:hypothetical protein